MIQGMAIGAYSNKFDGRSAITQWSERSMEEGSMDHAEPKKSKRLIPPGR